MALVTKNDVTQIFAIQAPEIDLPPTFANYPRGWDTARSNNGKPTIKQFNYIQQRTDQNVLWIHQNGAALPYDAAMEYAETAHVVKDGELQKKQGASWVIPYLGKSNNLDDVPDKATARNNLDVMSATEVNTAISNAIPPTSPDATETVAGKAKIATTAIAQEGVNDTDFITALKLKNTVFGLGQNRKVVTKISGTTYTNTTGKPVGFEVIFKSTGADYYNTMSSNITVNSEIRQDSGIYASDATVRCSMFVIILPNESYSFNAVRLSIIEKVTEIS